MIHIHIRRHLTNVNWQICICLLERKVVASCFIFALVLLEFHRALSIFFDQETSTKDYETMIRENIKWLYSQ